MTTTEDRLAAAMSELAETAPHDEALVRTVRRQAKRRTSRLVGHRALMPMAAAATVLTVVGASYLLTEDDNRLPAAPSGSAVTSQTPRCGPVNPRLLPAWARSGFSAPYRATYVTSASRQMIAVLFVPLREPQRAGTFNKVLWVPRHGVADPVTIDGQRQGSVDTTRTVLPQGLGPSTMNVPRPGCWHLNLHWRSGHDSINLHYAAR